MTDTAPFVVRPWAADVAAVTGSVAVAAVLSLAYLSVAGRFLGPAEYSDFAAAISLATLLAVALGALTPITSVLSARYIAADQPARVRGLVARLLGLVLLAGVALFVFVLVAGSSIARLLQLRSAAVLSGSILVYIGIAASSVIRAALRGSQRFREYGWGVIAEAVARLAAGVALLLMSATAILAVLPYAVGTLIASYAGLRVIDRLDPHSERVELRELTGLLGPTVLLLGSMAIYQNMDVLLVKHFFRSADAGLYGAAAGLARTMALLLMPLEALLLPRLTYLLERREETVRPIARLTALFIMLAAIPLLLFGLAPRLVMTLMYGRAYEGAAPLLLPLASAMLMLYLSYVGGQALISVGRHRFAFAFAALVVIEVTLLLVLHPSLSSVAAILVSTRATAFVLMLVSFVGLRRQ